MGMFPYDCIECGGGYYRCGRGTKCNIYPKCDGGQFCWEDRSYILYNGKWIDTTYNGYGDHIHKSNENKEIIYVYSHDYKFILCRSCYRKNKVKYNKKKYTKKPITKKSTKKKSITKKSITKKSTKKKSITKKSITKKSTKKKSTKKKSTKKKTNKKKTLQN